MNVDPWILGFSVLTVVVTIWMGFWAAKKSRTASDFFVAGRGVSVGWNASAISGEYLSAASFMGIAGMVMSSGYDALWYPVCYACGYLFLLLFIAGPLRRFGAYTIPDFAEGRYDSPVFRRIAVVFVLFIGFFYTMPQMKGAGTTLAYVFQEVDLRGGWLEVFAPKGSDGVPMQGFPYWAGVMIVGGVITFNVALGGMKGITLVQAFQYWLKMFAISVPVFVLMATYGHYGSQVGSNSQTRPVLAPAGMTPSAPDVRYAAWDERGASRGGLGGPDAGRGLREIPSLSLASAAGMSLAPASLAQTPVEGRPALDWPFPRRDESWGRLEMGPRNAANWRDRWHDLWRRVRSGWSSRVAPVPAVPMDALVSFYFLDLLPRPEKFTVFFAPGMSVSQTIIRPGASSAIGGRSGPPRSSIPALLASNGYTLVHLRRDVVKVYPTAMAAAYANAPVGDPRVDHAGEVMRRPLPTNAPGDATWLAPFGPLTTKAARAAQAAAKGTDHEIGEATVRSYALVYTYSLIMALVCGTAGLPHILVRFYTNPDGVAAKRTTMWVMILIGVFYVFPPVFGVMGRNLMPELYAGAGAKGTDKVVLELPKVLDARSAGAGAGADAADRAAASMTGEASSTTHPPPSAIPWGSILSGITCAGAFAAFMSTFSGLLVSMTGALAHDVYGRILRPASTAAERMRMFKVFAWVIGGVATLLGCFVEPLQINFMVGQAFAIAAASYFPLLFMSVWWRGMTVRGAATGMLAGGIAAVMAVSVTNFSDLGWLPLKGFWTAHPLLRILCEQPAIWAVPGAILLMIVISKLTRREVPADIRMKMLVLHAPEALGLKQEYIREHEAGH